MAYHSGRSRLKAMDISEVPSQDYSPGYLLMNSSMAVVSLVAIT